MKASEELTKKPRIDVRHMIDHDGLAVALGYAFKVDGNEDGDGGDGDGGAGDSGDSGDGSGGKSGGEDSGKSDSTGDTPGGADSGQSTQSTVDAPPGKTEGDIEKTDTETQTSGDSSVDGGESAELLASDIFIEAPRAEQPMPALPFDFETRAREVRRRALGAGAQRSGNMADLLGYVPTRKARGEARRVLGER